MKKILVIILFLCLVIPNIVGIVWLKIEQVNIRKEVKGKFQKGLDNTELIQFTFNTKDIKTKLRWHNTKEFEFEECMYDIIKESQDGEQIVYWCFQDKKETKLNKKFEIMVSKAIQQNSEHNTKHQLIQDFVKINYLTSKKLKIDYSLLNLAIINIFDYKFSIQIIELTPPTPPPNFV